MFRTLTRSTFDFEYEYVPEGVEMKYRVWKADPTANVMEKG